MEIESANGMGWLTIKYTETEGKLSVDAFRKLTRTFLRSLPLRCRYRIIEGIGDFRILAVPIDEPDEPDDPGEES